MPRRGESPRPFYESTAPERPSEPSADSWARALLILVSGGCLGPARVLALPCALGRRGQEPRGGGGAGHGLPGLLPKPRAAPTDRHPAQGAGVCRQGKTRLSASSPGGRGGRCRQNGALGRRPVFPTSGPLRRWARRAPPGGREPAKPRCPALTGRAGLEDLQGAGARAQTRPPLRYPRRPPRPGNCVTWKR